MVMETKHKIKARYIVCSLLIFCCFLFSTSSCSKDDDGFNLTPFSSLFSTTDYFVDMLDKVYESYDLLGKKTKNSSDGKYIVTPRGRLIEVEKKSSNSTSYSTIVEALKIHYKNNKKVNDIFQNRGGTITIDCRK